MTTRSVTGGCLCGRIRFRIEGNFGVVANCHCTMCRKAQGCAFATNADVDRREFMILKGAEAIAEYESSPGKFRCFCRACGSPVYSHRLSEPSVVRVRFGTLDDDPGVRPELHFAVDFKAPWFDITDGLPRIDASSHPVGSASGTQGPRPGMPSNDEVLGFWFADSARWWKKDPAFDAEVRDRFLALHEAIERGERESWLETASGTLAYVIVLDQFSRNMFRGTARMLASDARARTAARRALERGDDAALSPEQRTFHFMPFVHSEDIADQDRGVALFAHAPPEQVRLAEQHRDIIRRFGRFPHRNALLGRESTPEEKEFLKQPGSSF
jgi:uncharacterized protein (DUF924 family)